MNDAQTELAISSADVVCEAENTMPERSPTGQFLPGHKGIGGRPPGRVSLTGLTRELLEANDQEEARAVVANLLSIAKGAGRDAVAAARILLDRIDGPIATSVELGGSVEFLPKVFLGLDPEKLASGTLDLPEVVEEEPPPLSLPEPLDRVEEREVAEEERDDRDRDPGDEEEEGAIDWLGDRGWHRIG